MWEHRLIEKMLRIVEREVARMEETRQITPVFVDTVVDFIRTYADRTHHGKEEDILFRDLARKPLTPEHAKIMDELMAEHVYSRKTVARLVEAKEAYLQNGSPTALTQVMDLLRELAAFYPKHIEKEDKNFFYPCLKYFSDTEQQAMLLEFRDFDGRMIHEKYGKIVEKFRK